MGFVATTQHTKSYSGACATHTPPSKLQRALSISESTADLSSGSVMIIHCDATRREAPPTSSVCDIMQRGKQRLERSSIGAPGSKLSEMLSFEMLMTLLPGASLHKSEEEFKRAMGNHGQGGVVDYLLLLPSGGLLGCSVTRGFGYGQRSFS
jgi:hypothetical protein